MEQERCECGWELPAGLAFNPPDLKVGGIAILCPRCENWMGSDAIMEVGRGTLDGFNRAGVGQGKEKGH